MYTWTKNHIVQVTVDYPVVAEMVVLSMAHHYHAAQFPRFIGLWLFPQMDTSAGKQYLQYTDYWG